MTEEDSVAVALPADVNQVDDAGYVWAFLNEAAELARVRPGALIVAGDAVEPFLARAVDVIDGPNEESIVHLNVFGVPERAIDEFRHGHLLPRYRPSVTHRLTARCPVEPLQWILTVLVLVEKGRTRVEQVDKIPVNCRDFARVRRVCHNYDIFEGTEQIQQLVSSSAHSPGCESSSNNRDSCPRPPVVEQAGRRSSLQT